MVWTWNGARLREHRRRAGMSLETLAIAAGRSAAAITAYELDRARPPLLVAVRLADALEVEVRELLTRQPSTSAARDTSPVPAGGR